MKVGDLENVKPRTTEVGDNLLFRLMVEDFLTRYFKDFAHIDLNHFLVIKHVTPHALPEEKKYVEIVPLDEYARTAFPQFYYVIAARDDINYLTDYEKDKWLHYWFCHIPRDYRENPTFAPYDFPAGFQRNVLRFTIARSKNYKELEERISRQQDF